MRGRAVAGAAWLLRLLPLLAVVGAAGFVAGVALAALVFGRVS